MGRFPQSPTRPTLPSARPRWKVGFPQGRYQDSTWVEGYRNGSYLRAAISDGKSRRPLQICGDPSQDNLRPGPVNRNPEVWYDQ